MRGREHPDVHSRRLRPQFSGMERWVADPKVAGSSPAGRTRKPSSDRPVSGREARPPTWCRRLPDQVVGHVGDDHARPEQQRRAKPQGSLVVEQVAPPGPRDQLRQHHGNRVLGVRPTALRSRRRRRAPAGRPRPAARPDRRSAGARAHVRPASPARARPPGGRRAAGSPTPSNELLGHHRGVASSTACTAARAAQRASATALISRRWPGKPRAVTPTAVHAGKSERMYSLLTRTTARRSAMSVW